MNVVGIAKTVLKREISKRNDLLETYEIIEKMYNLGYKLSNSIWSNESIFRDDIDENIYVNIVENEGYIQTKESS